MKKKDCIPYVFHIQSFSFYLLIALFQRLPRWRSRFSRILLSRPLCLMNPDQVTLILIGKVEGNHILQLAAQLADRTFSRLHLFLQFARFVRHKPATYLDQRQALFRQCGQICHRARNAEIKCFT